MRLSVRALVRVLCVLAAASASAVPYLAVDALGRQLSFAQTPERVLVVGRATLLLADAVYIFPGARQRVVGIGETDQGLGDSLPLLDRDWQRKARFANSVGPEEVAAAKPDLVVLKTTMKSRLGDALERIGIPVFYLDLESPESFRRDLASLGDVFQEPDRAKEIVRWYDERVAAVQAHVAGAARPRVLLVQSAGRDTSSGWSIPPAGWIQSWMTKAAGGEPVWLDANTGSAWLKVGLEQMAAWRPETVLVVSYQEPAVGPAERLRGSLAAGVHPFPADYASWDQADARWILGLQWLAATLHPEGAAGFNLAAEVESFYGELYGTDLATVRTLVLPRLARSLGTP